MRMKKIKSTAKRESSKEAKQRMVKKKRVSFSTALESTRLIGAEEEKHFNMANEQQKEEMPKKSILKKFKAADLSTSEVVPMKKRHIVAQQNKDETLQRYPNQQKQKKKGKWTKFKVANKSLTIKKTKTINVKRSTKEMLMKMNKRERKEFIRKLAEKNKPNFELMAKAKKLWEIIRSSKTPKEKREKSTQKLLELCQGKLSKLVYSHSMCRVIQCLFALNRADIRRFMFDELKPEILAMAKSKYARFFVFKMLKYGSKEQRNEVIRALKGHYVRLFKIAHSAELVDSIFGEWAVAEQYHSIVAEFFGPEYFLFQQDQQAPQNIQQISAVHPEKVPLILKNLESILEGVNQKIPTLRLSITHKLLLEYLSHCSAEQRQSMIDNLKDHLPEICHTRDGSRTALICVWNAKSEDQEAMVRSFTGLVVRSCQDEFVRRVLFGIFDHVDNTELINQIIVKEIANNIADLIYNKNAIWVFHYLVHPRDHRVIGRGLFDILKEGDSNLHDKRKPEIRYAELFECIRPSLLNYMKTNMREMIWNKISAVLILDTLEIPAPSDPFQRHIPMENLRESFRAIAEIASDEFIPHSPDGPSHIVQGGCARFVFRKLLNADPHREEGSKLSDAIAAIVPPDGLASWTGMDCGCYTLLEMLKSGSVEAKNSLERALNLNNLEKSNLKGAAKLLYQLNGKEAEETMKINSPKRRNLKKSPKQGNAKRSFKKKMERE